MFFIYGTVISYNIKAAPFRHHCDSRKGPLILFTEVLLLQVSGYIDTAGGCMGKRMCNTAAVSDNKETFVAGFQILIDLNFHVVEFNLNTIKQSIVICCSRCDLIQSIDHLDDSIQDTLRHNKA